MQTKKEKIVIPYSSQTNLTKLVSKLKQSIVKLFFGNFHEDSLGKLIKKQTIKKEGRQIMNDIEERKISKRKQNAFLRQLFTKMDQISTKTWEKISDQQRINLYMDIEVGLSILHKRYTNNEGTFSDDAQIEKRKQIIRYIQCLKNYINSYFSIRKQCYHKKKKYLRHQTEGNQITEIRCNFQQSGKVYPTSNSYCFMQNYIKQSRKKQQSRTFKRYNSQLTQQLKKQAKVLKIKTAKLHQKNILQSQKNKKMISGKSYFHLQYPIKNNYALNKKLKKQQRIKYPKIQMSLQLDKAFLNQGNNNYSFRKIQQPKNNICEQKEIISEKKGKKAYERKALRKVRRKGKKLKKSTMVSEKLINHLPQKFQQNEESSQHAMIQHSLSNATENEKQIKKVLFNSSNEIDPQQIIKCSIKEAINNSSELSIDNSSNNFRYPQQTIPQQNNHKKQAKQKNELMSIEQIPKSNIYEQLLKLRQQIRKTTSYNQDNAINRTYSKYQFNYQFILSSEISKICQYKLPCLFDRDQGGYLFQIESQNLPNKYQTIKSLQRYKSFQTDGQWIKTHYDKEQASNKLIQI